MNSEILEIEPETKECEIQTCDFCDICFTNLIDLNVHKKETHINLLNNIVDCTPTKDNTMCKYCYKVLCNRKSRWRHEKICKTQANEIENLKSIILELEGELIKERKKYKNLTNMMKTDKEIEL